MPQTFIDGFRYDRWADRRWCDRLRDLPSLPKATSLLSHLGATKQVWLGRLQGEDTSLLEIWPNDSLDEAVDRVTTAGAAMQEYVAAQSRVDLGRDARYQNSSGVTFDTPVRDILMHVLTHGHYHRGQIAQHVRAAGHDPVWTDYIAFSRQQKKAN